jgi:aryl-alcohol dehydrogenase-like predicted oxidoreductase
LQTIQYDFLQNDDSVATALRFTLAIPGVDVAIVGTTNPNRYQQNAATIAQGNISQDQYNTIRARWEERADQHWLSLS